MEAHLGDAATRPAVKRAAGSEISAQTVGEGSPAAAPQPPGTEKRPSTIRSALSTYGTNVAVAFLSLANVFVVARVLGPSGRGTFAFLTAVAYLSSQVAILGVHQSNLNFAGRDRRLLGALATNSLVLSLVLGVSAVAVVAGLIAVFPSIGAGVDPALRWLALASVPLLVLQVCLQSLVIACYGFTLNNVAWLIAPTMNLTVNGLLAVAGALTVGTAFATWVAGQLLSTVLYSTYVSRRLDGFRRPDLALARKMLSFGIKTHGGRVLLLGNFRFDQWLMAAMVGSTQLGLYSVAVAWSEALFFLPQMLMLVQRPDLVRASADEAARQAATAFRAALLLTAVMVVAMVLLAPFLCATVFGPSFHASIIQLRVLTLGAFGIVSLKVLGNALLAQAQPLLETAVVSAAFVIVVVLDVLLIPAHAGLGASIASAIGYSAGGLAAVFVFSRALRRPLHTMVPTAADIAWLWRTAVRQLRSLRTMPTGS